MEHRNAGEIMVDCGLHEILGYLNTRVRKAGEFVVCQRLRKCDDGGNIDKNTRRNVCVGIR